MSNIEWTNRTWNPMVGCSKVSPGCQNCYAIKDAHRLAGNPNAKINSVYAGLTERRGDRTEWTGKVNFVPERLELPLKTRKPTTWFVNSMSDLFHESVTDDQVDRIFAAMILAPRHTFQVLTKRPERMAKYIPSLIERLQQDDWGICREKGVGALDGSGYMMPIEGFRFPFPNVWLGVTVENQKAADGRIPLLLQTPAAVRFLSCEPLLEGVDLARCGDSDYSINSLTGAESYGSSIRRGIVPRLDWVIVGGESGHGARPCDADWISSIVEQCAVAKVPCFVKQLGSRPLIRCRMPGDSGWDEFGPIVRTTGKGGNPDEWPEALRVREFPVSMPTTVST